MLRRLKALFGMSPSSATLPRRKLSLGIRPDIIYAIGDTHGCHTELLQLEKKIIAASADEKGSKLIVMLGDYVDRGPKSREVIDHLIAPPPQGFERICLAGNHEQIMGEFLAAPGDSAHWFNLGGLETLASYGIAEPDQTRSKLGSKSFKYVLESHIPEEHVTFISELPSVLVTPGFIFAHAGLRPGVEIDQQSDQDLLWIRREFLESNRLNPELKVVHGHTPAKEPIISPGRIGIDTGVYMTGRLTALRIDATDQISFIYSD